MAELSHSEIADILAATQGAASAWMKGDANPYLAFTTEREDYTIMGPFGGPTVEGSDRYCN